MAGWKVEMKARPSAGMKAKKRADLLAHLSVRRMAALKEHSMADYSAGMSAMRMAAQKGTRMVVQTADSWVRSSVVMKDAK